jgi:hypothetical protein
MLARTCVGCVLAVVVAIGLAGCGSSSDSGGGASMDQMAGTVEAQKAERKQQEEEAALKAAEAKKAADSQPVQPQIEVVTAHSPKKGRLEEGGGYLKTVTGTRFWAEHQIILNNIREAMNIWHAEHDRYPKTQEEYMREIITPNEPSTRLPELPEGWDYLYDPKDPLVLKMINKGGGKSSAVE